MAFPLRNAAIIITFLQLVSGTEYCIWCNRKAENGFLDCFANKLKANPELNVEPNVVDSMAKSLKAASRVMNTPDNIKSEIMKGAAAGEVMAIVLSEKSPGKSTNSVVASVVASIEECYTTVTGLSGAKFSKSIGRAVTSLMSDEDSDSNSDDYGLPPESGIGLSNDYPNPPPVIENSPPRSQNRAFPAIKPQRNFGPSRNMPFRSLPPSSQSVAASSIPQTRRFSPNARRNPDNGAPFQPQDYSSPGFFASSSANAPQNGDNYAPSQSQYSPTSGSSASSSGNAPQNGDNFVPQNRDNFAPQNRDNFAPQNGDNSAPQNGDNSAPQNEDNSAPQNEDNSAPHNRDNFGPQNGGNFAPQNGDNFGPQNGGNFGPQNRGNFAPPQRQDFTASGSFASSSANAPQNGDNAAPQNGENSAPQNEDNSAPQNGDNSAPQNGDNFGPQNGGNFGPQNRGNFGPQNRGNFGPQNRGNFAPPQRQDFTASGSFASSSVNAPQNEDSFVPQNRDNFAPQNGGNFVPQNRDTFAAQNRGNFGPQNRGNFAPPQRQDFPASGSFASSSANAPQNEDSFVPQNRDNFAPQNGGNFAPQNRGNFAPPQRQDFTASGSFASSSAIAPQNEDSFAPQNRDNFAPQNGDNYARFQRNPPLPNPYASDNSNVGPNGDNYTPLQGQNIPAPNSYAPANSKVARNGDNYAPNNKDQPFLGKNSQLAPYSPVIPQYPMQPAPIIPGLNQPSYVPFPSPGIDSIGSFNSERTFRNDQSINPPLLSPVEQNMNKSPEELNAGASSQTSYGRNNNAFQDYPNYAETNIYKGKNIGPNDYYNDYGNNRWVPNGQPTYGLALQDNGYNPINSQASGINSDGNLPQRTQDFPSSFPFQANFPPSYQPLNDQSEYQNSDNQFVAPAPFAIANSDDGGSGMALPESSDNALTLQQAPGQEYNDQPNVPSSIEVPQSDETGFGRRQPTSNDGTSALAQNNFNDGPQTAANEQVNIPTNDDWVPQNGQSSEETATIAPTQIPTTPATTKAPATTQATTPKPSVNSNKSCAIEFAEAIFVHLSENDSFNCAFNEDTPHSQAVSIASEAIQNAFNNAGLPNYANQAKRYCTRQLSQLPSGAATQKYAEKFSKSAMTVVYKNDLLDMNCKEAGKYMAEQILNAIADISGASNADDNEQDKEPSENENKNPSQSNNTPIAASAVASEEGPSDYDNNLPQPNNGGYPGPIGSLAASQAPDEGTPVNMNPPSVFPNRLSIKNRKRGEYPSISYNNAPDDASSGASSNSETPVSPQKLDGGNPDNYNSPASNNVPSAASAAASEDGSSDYDNNLPQPNNGGYTGPTGSLAASQSPVNNNRLRDITRRISIKNRRRGGYPSIYNNNAPDDASSGASSNSETPVSPQKLDSENPDNYDSPVSNNAPGAASAAASEEGPSDYDYNLPQPNNGGYTGPTGSLAASQSPVNNNRLRDITRRISIKNRRRGGYPSIYNNNAPDDASSGASSNSETPVSPQKLDSENPDNYDSPVSNNAPGAASAAASEEGPSDYDYNLPQPNNGGYTGPTGSLAASQSPVNNNRLRDITRRISIKNRRRGGYPSIYNNNAPDDASSGASSNSETPVSPQKLDSENPDNYDSPVSNNAPGAASAAASEEGPSDYDYNLPQPNNGGYTGPTGSLAASQSPVNNNRLRDITRRISIKNRRRGGYPSIYNNNAPDDASSGASSNSETPVSPQKLDSENPDNYDSPVSNNAPGAASAAASEEGPSDYDYNLPQPNNGGYTGPTGSLAASQSPVNNNRLRDITRRISIKNRRRGGYPSIYNNNAPDDASSGASSNSEAPVSPQKSDSGNPDYYNSPVSNDAPGAASAAAYEEGPSDYDNNLPQPNNGGYTGPTGSLAESQAPEEGSPVNKNRLRDFTRRIPIKNRRRGGYPSIYNNNAPDDASSGASSNSETPVSPQKSGSGNPDYYDSPVSNNTPSAESAAASQSSNSENPNNYDNNAPSMPTSDGQPPEENNPDKSGMSNSKENPLLNQLKDPDSKNYIQHLMRAAMNCVSPDGFDYKTFTMELASVATAMKNEDPDKSPDAIIGKTYITAIVALIQDFQNAIQIQQENNVPQSRQPQPNFYRSNSDSVGYAPPTNYQNSGSSAAAAANSQSAPVGYQNAGNYQNAFQAEPLNYQNSGSSAFANSESDLVSYQNVGNYQNAFQAEPLNYQNSGSSAVANSESDPVSYQNVGNYPNALQAEPLNYQNSGSSAVANSESGPVSYQNVGNYQNAFQSEPSNYQNSGSSAAAVANSESDPVSYQNVGNYQNTFQAEPLNGNPLQNPSLQNGGQNSWSVNNAGNNLLNVGPRNQPANFGYNKNGNFAYAAAG
ncbi:unnamed protein product, partial [Larinioides sclopetarius]